MEKALLIAWIAFVSFVASADADELSPNRSSLRHLELSAQQLVTVDTAAGNIVVARSIADRMKGFIADVVGRGFKGPVHCYSWSKSHVRNSLHHSGEACDFAQHWTAGGLRTHPVMRRVGDLVAKWGLRDGCAFRDCGHIDGGLNTRTHAVIARSSPTHQSMVSVQVP